MKNKIRDSLKISFWDGIFASGMLGLISDYITPYALALKATATDIGFLNAVPNLTSSLIQSKSADFTEKLKSRKKLISLFIFFQAAMLLPVVLIPYLFKSHQILILIILITLFTSLGAFVGPAWASLMSEYVPYKMRGKYFGWRNKLLGIIVITCAFLSGFILHHFRHNILRGFFLIFFLASLFRFISWYFLTRMYEPPLKVKRDSYFSILDFISRIRESNFAKFVMFVSGFNFCVNIAAPFFPVFMLRDLKFNYITYTVLATSVTIAHIFTIDRWGKLADKTGNLKIIKITALFISFNPLFWVISRNPVYLIFAQVAAGFAWAGFNLCATNFIYDAVTPQKRVRCIAYFNVFTGLALFTGALLGGFLVNVLPPLFGYKILMLFLIASMLRLIVAVFFSKKIREVRNTEHINSRDLFYSAIGLKPIFDSPQNGRHILREEE